MSLIDKLSQMFDGMMEKAIEHHRKSSIYRGGERKKATVPLSQEEREQDALEFQQSQLDIQDNKRTVARARLQSQRASQRLRQASSNLSQLTSPGSMASAGAVDQARREVRRETRRHKQAQTKRERVEGKLSQSRKRNQELFERLRTGTKEGEVLTPSREQKDAFLGRTMDRVLQTKGFLGANLSDIFGSMRGNPEAKINMVGAGVSQMLEGMQGTKNSLGADGRPTEAVGGVLRTVSGGLMATGNPYAMAAGAVLKLGEAAVKSVDHLRDWGETLHQANIRFADYSPSMAVVKAEQQVRDIMYSQDRGEARSASADRLARAKHDLNLAMAPADDSWQNFKNNLGASLSRALIPVVKTTTNLVERFGAWASQSVPALGPVASWLTGDVKPGDDENKKKDAMTFADYLKKQQKEYGRRGY